MPKLDEKQRREIAALSSAGLDSAALAERFGVSRSTVNRVLRSAHDAGGPTAPEPPAEPAHPAPEPPAPAPVEPELPPYSLDEDLTTRMLACRHKVYAVMDLYLDALLDLERFGKVSPNQLTSALGTLLDKWGALEAQTAEEDAEGGGGVIVLGELEEA